MAEMKMPGLQYVSGAALPGAEESLDKYKQATQKVSEALERRINEPSTNWFEIAGAALAPTRSGNFFESLGNVNTVMGQQQRRAEERELPIAQMRAQLAGQQYQTEQDARAQKMLSSALGGADLQSVAQMLATPEGAISNPAIMGRLFALQGALPPDSKFGTQVKNLIDTQAKMIDIGLKSGQLNLEQLKVYNQGLQTEFETGVKPVLPNINRSTGQQPTAGQPSADQTSTAVDFSNLGSGDWRVTSGTGPRTLRGSPSDHGMGLDVGGVKAGTVANAPVTGTVVDVGNNKGLGNYLRIKTPEGNIVTAAHWQNVNVKAGDEVIAGQTPIGAVGSTGNSTGPHIHFEAKGSDGKPLDPRTLFASTQPQQAPRTPLTPKQLTEVEKTRQEEELKSQREASSKRGEPFQKKFDALTTYDYNTVQTNDLKNRELIQLVKDHPNVVGQLVHQGPLYALLQAAESGVSTPFGSLSVPVTEALNKLKMTPEEQAVARNILQITSDLNQTIMRTGKDIYGPQISAFDAQEMAKPGFKATDPMSFLVYLAGKNIVTNKFLGEMADAQQKYFEDNKTASTSSFFSSRNKIYTDIVDRFNATMRDLVENSPYRKK